MGDPPDEPPGETPAAGSHDAPTEPSNDMEVGGHDQASEDVEMDFIGSVEPYDILGSLEPSADDTVSGLLLAQMGSAGRSYRREQSTAARKLPSAIYLPPRVTALIRQLKSRHVMPGYALDLTPVDTADGLPWDFNDPAKRLRARSSSDNESPISV